MATYGLICLTDHLLVELAMENNRVDIINVLTSVGYVYDIEDPSTWALQEGIKNHSVKACEALLCCALIKMDAKVKRF